MPVRAPCAAQGFSPPGALRCPGSRSGLRDVLLAPGCRGAPAAGTPLQAWPGEAGQAGSAPAFILCHPATGPGQACGLTVSPSRRWGSPAAAGCPCASREPAAPAAAAAWETPAATDAGRPCSCRASWPRAGPGQATRGSPREPGTGSCPVAGGRGQARIPRGAGAGQHDTHPRPLRTPAAVRGLGSLSQAPGPRAGPFLLREESGVLRAPSSTPAPQASRSATHSDGVSHQPRSPPGMR